MPSATPCGRSTSTAARSPRSPGNAVADGDSGCVIQRGASDTTVTGNRWERCRTGLLAWDAGAVRYHGNTIVDVTEPDQAVTIGP